MSQTSLHAKIEQTSCPHPSLSFYKGKSILVTGASGYLGSRMIQILSDVSCKILSISRKQGSFDHAAKVSSQAQYQNIFGDVRDRSLWENNLEGVDVLFHFAGQTSAVYSDEHPDEDYRANVLPILHFLEVCRLRHLSPSVLFAGTVTESGIPRHLPVNEKAEDNPLTFYDFHKWTAENYLKFYSRLGAVQAATLRLPNIYGPGRDVGSGDRGILNRMIRKALAGETLTVFGEGSELRDYLYIEDALHAFLAAGASIKALAGGHYVIGTGTGHSLRDAFELIRERVHHMTGRMTSVAQCPAPVPQPLINHRNFIADSRLFCSLTAWTPAVTLSQGIDRTIGALL